MHVKREIMDPKLSLAVCSRRLHVLLSTQMTKPLLLILSVATLTLSTGCLFSRKSRGAKEGSAIASENEETLRRRWVEKRVSELTAQGTAAEAARTQAESEFREKFGFNSRTKH
jgi:hypothetical protein